MEILKEIGIWWKQPENREKFLIGIASIAIAVVLLGGLVTSLVETGLVVCGNMVILGGPGCYWGPAVGGANEGFVITVVAGGLRYCTTKGMGMFINWCWP